MAAAAIWDFQKIKFLTADTLERPNLRHPAKFHQDRSIRCKDVAIFRFFRMAVVRHLGFLTVQLLRFVRPGMPIRVTVPNLVEIG